MQGLRRLVLFASLGLFGAACGDDFEPPSKIRGLRVLGVRAEGTPRSSGEIPASGVPGETLHLEMLHADGAAPPDAPGEPLQFRWLAGCHNPPSRLYYGCEPTVRELATSLELPAGALGFESSFDVAIPADILTSAQRLTRDPVHFGVSYVFFAVCAGQLRVSPERAEGIPFDCVDPKDLGGPALGPDRFVTGYTTLYTYEGLVNHNPELESLTFDGTEVSGEACAEPDGCVPRVPACPAGSKCRKYEIAPRASAGSFERTPDGKSEILWASFYATRGKIAKDQQLVADRAIGPVADYSSSWTPPETPGRVRFWITLNDERGGAAWRSFDVEVE